MGTKAILAWSGGKDSAMALHEIRRAVPFTAGMTVRRDNRFLYLDLILKDTAACETPLPQQSGQDKASPLTSSILPEYNSPHGGI